MRNTHCFLTSKTPKRALQVTGGHCGVSHTVAHFPIFSKASESLVCSFDHECESWPNTDGVVLKLDYPRNVCPTRCGGRPPPPLPPINLLLVLFKRIFECYHLREDLNWLLVSNILLFQNNVLTNLAV